MRFHDLRHSCASLLLANGVPLKHIQEWLGHSDFTITANICAHLDYKSKTGDGDRACSTGGWRLRKSLEGGLSRKSGEKNKSLLWSLTLRKRYKKKPIIGLITGFFGGGDGGIRTLVPQGASWFRVMSVMTTSIRLQILVIYLVYCTCFLCDCQAKLHKFVNFKFNL